MAADPSRLQSLSIFAALSRLEREAIARPMREIRVAAGEVCLRAGERPPGLFVLVDGLVRGNLEEADGELAFKIKEGGCVGEFSLLEDRPSQFTYAAVSDSTIYVLDAVDFYEIVWKHPVVGVKILKAMIRASIASLAGANSILDGLVRVGEKARLRSIYDPLTGLFNRRYLEESMDQFFRRARARPCALIMIDVDRFRELNANISAMGADRILARLGSFIWVAVPDGGIAARLAGDEFAIFLPDADADEGRRVAVAIADRVATTAVTEPGSDEGFRLTLSQGVAACPGNATSASALMKAADGALLKAKREGRDRIALA
ncbi:MAG TPA: GGDEF domain-containing protein [Spirochaetia bacterium]|nr:GGDEF domain-containing protein [Spirochaetia bacterium]